VRGRGGWMKSYFHYFIAPGYLIDYTISNLIYFNQGLRNLILFYAGFCMELNEL
jgi:hypothetical protein